MNDGKRHRPSNAGLRTYRREPSAEYQALATGPVALERLHLGHKGPCEFVERSLRAVLLRDDLDLGGILLAQLNILFRRKKVDTGL